jgi:hypothetical protein
VRKRKSASLHIFLLSLRLHIVIRVPI